MKLIVRRIGNSLGVIVPKAILDAWGIREGGQLDLTDGGIRPVARGGFSTKQLDEHKRRLAAAVAARFTAMHIRAQGLGNLHRWKANGVWNAAYAEWTRLLESADDGELFAALLGRDERSNQLRQSPPYVGMLPREEVRNLNEEAAG
ncbi:MAG TPA: AbrB/MazE/SpoVT family DNA-binding domain-containing protein [Steroidobacteraceae bacterium]|nr:AbrB/MazE/SpoVT family DNA-binding domain-containing protein [Steroidobacteraceae bacterium]